MRMLRCARVMVFAIAALSMWTSQGNQVSARSRESCFSCLTSVAPWCVENCDCHCSNPEHSASGVACGEGGYAVGQCRDWSNSHYSSLICDSHACPQSCTEENQACSSNGQCCTGYCGTESFVCVAPPSPILINLKNASPVYHLTSAQNGVDFDIDADGFANRVGWTPPDSDVAFLVMDRNGNGLVDDGSELFGTATRKRNGELAAHGFEALFDLDGGTGISDGKIAPNDSAYGALRLWRDRNHNGSSESNELSTLNREGIEAIFTTARETPFVDANGNQYKYVGLAVVRKKSVELPRAIFDVFFVEER